MSISDYTFANFYIWRLIDGTMITEINGNICAYVTTYDKKRYFMMPIGTNKMEDTLRTCLSMTEKVVRLPEDFIRKYIPDGGCFEVEDDRDNYDYIYLTKDLIELRGKKYDGKRNHINHFLKTGTFEYETLRSDHVKECMELNDKWCAEKKKESEAFPNIECEGQVVNEVLNNYELLDITGGVIKVNGRIAAFSLGQRLNKDIAVIHIEKYDTEIRGLSQLINREFARHAWSDTQFIDREQDMGHLGLRKAKMSYHPVRMEKKFNISLKDAAPRP